MESWHITSFGNQTWQWTMIDYQRAKTPIRIIYHYISHYIILESHCIYIYTLYPINLSPLLSSPGIVRGRQSRDVIQRRGWLFGSMAAMGFSDSGTPKHRLNAYHKNIYHAVNMYSYLTRFRFISIFFVSIFMYIYEAKNYKNRLCWCALCLHSEHKKQRLYSNGELLELGSNFKGPQKVDPFHSVLD